MATATAALLLYLGRYVTSLPLSQLQVRDHCMHALTRHYSCGLHSTAQ